MTILAAHPYRNNAELIVACQQLGYLNDSDAVLDPTYGRGLWWKIWRPTLLVGHDARLDKVDFRKLPHKPGEFDAAVFDPPYVAMGGRATSGLPDFMDRFGLEHVPNTPEGLLRMNIDGLRELRRVVKPRGFVLVKTMDYVSSGKLYPQSHHMLVAALKLGYEYHDRIEHIGHARAQPARSRKDGKPVRQHHARRNLSTLLVLRTPRAKKRSAVR